MVGEERIGTLPESDAMHAFLTEEVLCGRLGFPPKQYRFDAHRFDASGVVMRYVECEHFVDLVVKYYGRKWLDGRQSGQPQRRAELMHREFRNLEVARGLGLDWQPHRIVRPLALCEALECALVEEYAPGRNLEDYVRRAIDDAAMGDLMERLTDVAWFFADLHARSATDAATDRERPVEDLARLAAELAHWEIIGAGTHTAIAEAAGRWKASALLRPPRSVLIHGDATPTQFIFARDHDLTVIDLEHLRRADAAADLGRLAAELKHQFFWRTGDRWSSEPYIQHLYGSYGRFAGDAEDFERLTRRAQFYMGCDELRICRNHWLDLGYRRELVDEARACLAI